MATSVRAVHFLNQFFAGLGGEEAASIGPRWFDGARGPGQLIAKTAPDIEIIGTLAAGDNYVAENLEQAVAELVALLEDRLDGREIHLLLAGPAFNAGRYGLACSALCQAIERDTEVAAVTSLFPDNPAVDSYRRTVTMVRAGSDVMDMKAAIERMVGVGRKRVLGEGLERPDDDLIALGLRRNYLASANGAKRAAEMLMAKLAGEPFVTEYPMPTFDRVAPAPGVGDARKVTVALLTSGGIVPRGNPDRIEAANASRYGEYSIDGLDRLSGDSHESVHGGYDPTYANQDPNCVLPLDVMRAMERNGRIARLHTRYFATVGNATSVERAKRYGAEIAVKLVNEGVQAAVFTST